MIRVGDEIHIHNLHIDGGFVNATTTAARTSSGMTSSPPGGGGATGEYTGLDKPPEYTNIPRDEYVEIDRKSKPEEYAGLRKQTGSAYTNVPEVGSEYAQLKRKSDKYLELIADNVADNVPVNIPDNTPDNAPDNVPDKLVDNLPDIIHETAL